MLLERERVDEKERSELVDEQHSERTVGSGRYRQGGKGTGTGRDLQREKRREESVPGDRAPWSTDGGFAGIGGWTDFAVLIQ